MTKIKYDLVSDEYSKIRCTISLTFPLGVAQIEYYLISNASSNDRYTFFVDFSSGREECFHWRKLLSLLPTSLAILKPIALILTSNVAPGPYQPRYQLYAWLSLVRALDFES